MNKLFTKIVGVALGLTMAIGVGLTVAVGSNVKEATPVHATEATAYTMSISKDAGNSNYASSKDASITSNEQTITWNIPGNQTLGDYTKLGGKLSSSTTRSIYSKGTISQNITRIVVSTGKKDSQITVTSMTVTAHDTAADAANGSSAVSTFDFTYAEESSPSASKTGSTDLSGKYWRFNLTMTSSASSKNYGAIINSITFYYDNAPAKTLSSISLSGNYPTSFTQGDTFSHAGMVVTANYSDSTSATVTTSATWSSPDMSTTGNKTVTVSYSDEYGSASKTYSITVNYAAVTSVSLSENAAEIGLGGVFDYNLVTVTVSPSNANPDVTWSVDSNTVGDDYTFDVSGLLAGDTEGTITLKCESDADSSKYATLVVTVTGDPTAAFVKDSTSGYAGKAEEIAFTYSNIDDESKIAVVSSNPSIVSVANDLVADEGEGLVTINFVAVGSANVTISYDGGAALDTLPVTVSADRFVSVTWNASNFDVFSGTILTSDIDNTWLVSYEMASGDDGLLEYGDYTLKLGGAVITLPHTWVAGDSGKSLCVEYGGVSSSTVSVTVTQIINDVNADITSESTWSHSITATTWTAYGAKTLNGKAWTAACTAGAYWNYDGTKGQQFGKAADPCASLTLSSSAFSGTVSTVKVTTSGAKDVVATVAVSVGSTVFKSGGSESVSISETSTEYTFTGSGLGTITITWTQTSYKALYLKALSVTTVTSSGSQQIANNASHKAAQRVAVKFANAFNTAMDETENCTTGLSSAWSKCSSAYDTFKSEAAALGSAEEAYAKNLIKYATAQYSDDSGEACIERMMKTYEICVQNHGQTAFMSELVTLQAPRVTPLATIVGNSNTIAIIVVISMISATAIGGYFYLRKRKEN